MGVVAQVDGRQASIKIARPSWADMVKNYPKEDIKSADFYGMVSKDWDREVNKGEKQRLTWENTCAVRMSYALNRSGILLDNSKGNIKGDDGYIYWYRVSELSAFLEQKFKKPDYEYTPSPVIDLSNETFKKRSADIQKNFISKIIKKHGIIVFRVSGWGNASGHFTLWDGHDLLYTGDPRHNNPELMEYYFSFMRDIGNGKIAQTSKILFWELK